MRSPVKAFPRNLWNGLPLRRIGRSGDSRLTPNQNLLMPMADGQLESIWSQLHYAKRKLSPVRLVLKGTLFLSPTEGEQELVANKKGAI